MARWAIGPSREYKEIKHTKNTKRLSIIIYSLSKASEIRIIITAAPKEIK